MIIKFDGILVNNKYIMSLSQEAQLFKNQFELGSTLCRTLTLNVDKRGVSSIPTTVDLYEEIYNSDIKLQTEDLLDITTENGQILMTKDGITYRKTFSLLVDSVDEANNFYYSFTLTDKMVRFNKEFTYDYGSTVLELLDIICANHDISLKTRSLYLGDMVINWDQSGMSERDFIGYVAEVNGGYAYIDNDGDLVIKKYSNTIKQTIRVEDCSSFKVGAQHIIDRVYVELGSGTKYYPESTDNETCYLNPDNILLTDSGDYTIENIVRHIYNDINGLNFYNIVVDRYPIDDSVLCGEFIKFTLNNNNYPAIYVIDQSYSNKWIGGYELELDSAEQIETQIVNTTKRLKHEVSIIIDRELGSITQRVEDVEASVGKIEEDAIFKVDVLYAKGDSSTVAPTTGWSTNAPEWEDGKYIWQKTKTYYGDETSSESNPTCIQGAKGQNGVDGKDGSDGKGISSIVEQYYLSTSKTSLVGGSWQTSCPKWQKDHYIWTRSEITWSDSTVTYSTAVVSDGINGANEVATNTYETLTTYYSTSEQTNQKITQEVGAMQTTIMGDVEETYASKASLEMYVTEDTAKQNIASWINACADNIVLNASSKLVFGDLQNQYITISNYQNSSGEKTGVLFDGTGEIRLQTINQFQVLNQDDNGYYYNRIWLRHRSSGNDYYLYNYKNDNSNNYQNYMSMGNGTLNIKNYKQRANYQANYISMYNDHTYSTLSSGEKIEVLSSSSMELNNYHGSDSTNRISNSIVMSSMYKVDTTSELKDFWNNESKIDIKNYDCLTPSYIATQITIQSSDKGDSSYQNCNRIQLLNKDRSDNTVNNMLFIAGSDYTDSNYSDQFRIENYDPSVSTSTPLSLFRMGAKSNDLGDYMRMSVKSSSTYGYMYIGESYYVTTNEPSIGIRVGGVGNDYGVLQVGLSDSTGNRNNSIVIQNTHYTNTTYKNGISLIATNGIWITGNVYWRKAVGYSWSTKWS